MREQLKGEEGAVAVLVAILTVVLVGMAAFVVDFGIGYTTKRNLQKAADAAALAAAGKIIQLASPTDTCSDIVSRWNSDSTFHNAVQSQADSIATQNISLSQPTAMTVQCSSDNLRVEVSYSNTGSSPSVFGGIFGVTTLSSSRSATSDIFAATSGVGLRPYALCSTDAKTLSQTTGWVGIVYPSPSCGNYNGNWYTLDCPEDMGSNSTSTFANDTLNGCKDEVGVVTAGSGTVNQAIVDQCTASADGIVRDPQECMMANPGNVSANAVVDAWKVLLTKPSIMIPVFYPSWNSYAAAQVKACTTGGNGGCYPIQALASVKVCGYAWGPKTGYDDSSTVCQGVKQAVQNASTNGSTNELWLALTTPLQTTGSSGPGGVAVGQAFGVYGTRLIK